MPVLRVADGPDQQLRRDLVCGKIFVCTALDRLTGQLLIVVRGERDNGQVEVPGHTDQKDSSPPAAMERSRSNTSHRSDTSSRAPSVADHATRTSKASGDAAASICRSRRTSCGSLATRRSRTRFTVITTRWYLEAV